MSYKVIGAAAVVELDDGKPELGTGRRIYLEQNQAVPAEAKRAHIDHLLAIGLIEETAGPEPVEEPDEDDGNQTPAKSATRPEWDAYAKSQGLTDEEIASYSSKEDMQKHFGVE